jgi:hypothetical protein
MAEPWFNPNTFGAWYGSLYGGGGGTLAGTLGALAGTLAPKGKGKGLVLGGMAFFFLLGLASLTVGIVAAAMGQPGMIWQPMAYGGLLFSGIMAAVFPNVRRQYRLAEERKVEAESIRRG